MDVKEKISIVTLWRIVCMRFTIEHTAWLIELKSTGQWVTCNGKLTRDPNDPTLLKVSGDEFMARQWIRPMLRLKQSNFQNTKFWYDEKTDDMIAIQNAIRDSIKALGYDLYSDFIPTQHNWL